MYIYTHTYIRTPRVCHAGSGISPSGTYELALGPLAVDSAELLSHAAAPAHHYAAAAARAAGAAAAAPALRR